MDSRLIDPWPGVSDLYKVRMFDSRNIVAIGEGAVIITHDTGRTWKALDVVPLSDAIKFHPDGYVNEIGSGRFHASAFLDDSTAILAGDGGILQTTRDKGRTWNKSSSGIGEIRSVQSAPGGDLYLEDLEYGLYRRSREGGAARKLYQGKSGTTIAFDDSTAVSMRYETIQRGTVQGCILERTVDAGATWSGIGTGIGGVCWLEKQSDTSAYLLSRGKNYVTCDKGQTWREVTGNFVITPQLGLRLGDRRDYHLSDFFLDSAIGFRGWENGALQRTGNGGFSWEKILPSSQFPGEPHASAASPDGWGYFLGRAWQNFQWVPFLMHSRDLGRTWTRDSLPADSTMKAAFGKVQVISARRNGGLAGAGLEGTLVLREDRASPWRIISLGTQAKFTQLQFVGDSVGYLAGGTEPGTLGLPITFLKTLDGGRTWKPLPQPGSAEITYMIFVSPKVGFVRRSGTLSKTTDGGNTWTPASELLSGAREFHFGDESRGWLLAGSNDFYATNDGGFTWERDYTPLPMLDNILTSLHVFDSRRMVLFGSYSSDKMAVSIDGGKAWIPQKSGLHSTNAFSNLRPTYFGDALLTRTSVTQWSGFGKCFDIPVPVVDRLRAGPSPRATPLRGGNPAILFARPGDRAVDALGKTRRNFKASEK